MKTKLSSIFLASILFSTLYVPIGFTEDPTQIGLPDGAKARFGTGGMKNIAYSPDGTQWAVTSSIGIWLYDAGSGKVLSLLTTTYDHNDAEYSVVFSPDRQTLASGTRRGKIHLWDVKTGTLRQTLMAGTSWILSIAFSPDGQTLASAVDKDTTIGLWDTKTGTLRQTLTGHTSPIESITFSPDGQTLASGGRDSTIRLWDTKTSTLRQTLTGHKGWVKSITFSPDRQTLVSVGTDRTIRLWDIRTGTLRQTLTDLPRVTSTAFSPDGRILAVGGLGKIYLWDTVRFTHRHRFTELKDIVGSIAFSPNGQSIVGVVEDGTIRSWDVKTGKLRYLITGTGIRGYGDVALSSDSKWLAASGWGGIHLWDIETGTIRHFRGDSSFMTGVALSPNGQILAGASPEKTILLWDMETGKLRHTLTGLKGIVEDIAFSPNGQFLAGGARGGTIYVWNVETRRPRLVYTRHIRGRFAYVAFSPDGQTLASWLWDIDSDNPETTIRLWDVKTGTFRRTLRGHTDSPRDVAFSPDGQTLASVGDDETIRLWDTRTGKLRRTITRLPLYTRYSGVAFGSDGQTLICKKSYHHIDLWDLRTETGTVFRTFRGHRNQVTSMALSSDRQTLVTSSWDGTVILWELAPRVQVLLQASKRPPMYWIDATTHTLHRLVGTEVENLAPSVQNATDLAVDINNDKLYWGEKTSKRTGKIQRANLDGSNVQLVKELTSIPLDLVLDITDGKLYLTNPWGKIQRLNLDGSDFQPNLITGLQTPNHLALDRQQRKVYWTEQMEDGTGKIRRANLDGTNAELVKNLTNAPRSIAVNSVNRKIYLTRSWGKVQRLNLNGLNFQPNLITDLRDLGTVAVDVEASKLYWTTGDRIQRANLMGKDIETIVTGLQTPTGIALGSSVPDIVVTAAPQTVPGRVHTTTLFANYPNPFNPETWIPYQLAKPADVTIHIHAVDGTLVRTLVLERQDAGMYQSRSRAAYWNGKNNIGEPVASGIYFYTLTANDFTATQKMLIRK